MKKIFFCAIPILLFSCHEMASFSDKLQLYADIFNEPALAEINDSGGLKSICYKVKYNRSATGEDDSILRQLSALRGKTIEDCMLSKEAGKYERACFSYEFNNRTVSEEYVFNNLDKKGPQSTIWQRVKNFYGSINADGSAFLDSNTHEFVFVNVDWRDSTVPKQIEKKSFKSAQFVRFFILVDSAKMYRGLGFSENRPHTWSRNHFYWMDDESLYKLD